MSLFAAIHIAETQQRIADLRLKGIANQQDSLLKQKENASNLMDLLNRYKGQECSEEDMTKLRAYAQSVGIDVSALNGAQAFDVNGRKAYYMWVPTNDGDRKNREAWDGAIKQVQDYLDRSGDALTHLSTQSQQALTESQDGAGKVSGTLQKYEQLLKDLRGQ